MPNRKNFILLFTFFFLFRLFFGLCASKWWDRDELQTYLIGLKCFTTGEWPYFGPYVNGSESAFQSRIPGALEGLLISLPFHVLPIPEAPYIWLNLMTTAAAALLAWTLCRRLPGLAFPWIFAWICLLPWSLHEGTHIITPPYLFLPSVLFFTGFLETIPGLALGLFSARVANLLMGFGLLWIMQFHFSYVYLLPFAGLSLLLQTLRSRNIGGLFYFLLGALPLGLLVLPTFLKYGFGRQNVASGFAVAFNRDNAQALLTILARYLSLVSFEIPRFIGAHNADRWEFLKSHPAILVPGLLLWVAGIAQAVILFLAWFKRENPFPGWRGVKGLTLGAFVMVYASFWFTVKMPLSHIYFVLFPLVMIYSAYVGMFFAGNPRLRLLARVLVILGFLFQLGYAVAVAPKESLATQRGLVAQAIQERNFMLLVNQRPDSLY